MRSIASKAMRVGRTTAWVVGLAVTLAVVLSMAGPAAARPPYPATPPDFAHPNNPHSPLYSSKGGTTDRPMLVIYGQFTNVAPNPPNVPDPNAAWAARRFFGGFPSVADYFADDSFDKLRLTPATESNTTDGGAVNDGVVVVNLGDSDDFFNDPGNPPGQEGHLRAVLNAVDSLVDFSIFDTNSDGRISQDELVVHFFGAGREFRDCAVVRSVADGGRLDGMNVTGLPMSIGGTDTTNLMTYIHETGHLAFDMDDLYHYGVGTFDIAGLTCGFEDGHFFRTSAWQKMHIGWSKPTVVMEDGFYEVNRADRAGESFILYDPEQGTNRYYMVENRATKAGTYDSGAPDTGLVIWQIDDAQFGIDSNQGRPINLRRPDGDGRTPPNWGGSDKDAWDPSDPNTPQRSFENDDPAGPRVAVRAIPEKGEVMRVFFDVRGPGVLVDPSTPQGQPIQEEVVQGQVKEVAFPVMNTGEAADTFEFTLSGLPSGWTATTDTQTLQAGEGSTARIRLTPAADAARGNVTLNAVGTSTSDPTVTSNSSFTATVQLAPPANDNFAAAQAISGPPASVNGTNVAATREAGDPAVTGNDSGSVWYRWTAPSSGSVEINTCTSNYDTVLGAYIESDPDPGGAPGSLAEIAANDDTSGCGINGSGSKVTFNAQANTTYQIYVSGFGSSQGDFTLRVIERKRPQVTSVTPPNNATGVAPGINVTATFSEAMQASTINTSTFKLRRQGTTTFRPAAVSYNPASREATLNPSANLTPGATYVATVTSGAQDLAGNPLDQSPGTSGNQSKTWSFKVRR